MQSNLLWHAAVVYVDTLQHKLGFMLLRSNRQGG